MFEEYRRKHEERLGLVSMEIARARSGGATDEELFTLSRLKGLGGSDMASLMGLNPYKTPYMLWQEKTRFANGAAIGREKRLPLRFGHWNEGFVAQLYSERKGLELREHETVASEGYPFLLANFDRIVYSGGEAVGLLECKTTAYNSRITLPDGSQRPKWGRWETVFAPGEEEIDPLYMPQVQFYLGISGMAWCDVAVLIANSDFRIYRVRRNNGLISRMVAMAEEFWCVNVLDGSPPEMAMADLGAIRSADLDDDAFEADTDLMDKVQLAREAGKRKRAAEEEYRGCIEAVARAMDRHKRAVFRDGSGRERTLVSYGTQKRTRFDTASFREDHPELYDRYLVEQETERSLRIY